VRRRSRRMGLGQGLPAGAEGERRAAGSRCLDGGRASRRLRVGHRGSGRARVVARASAARAAERRDGHPALAGALRHRRRELASARPPHPPRLDGSVHGRVPPSGDAIHRGPRDGGTGRRADSPAGAGERRATPGDVVLWLRGGHRPPGRHRRHHGVHLRRRCGAVDGRRGGRGGDPRPRVRHAVPAARTRHDAGMGARRPPGEAAVTEGCRCARWSSGRAGATRTRRGVPSRRGCVAAADRSASRWRRRLRRSDR
jgi:hypothetical protein